MDVSKTYKLKTDLLEWKAGTSVRINASKEDKSLPLRGAVTPSKVSVSPVGNNHAALYIEESQLEPVA